VGSRVSWERLEECQVLLYFAALAAGGSLGLGMPQGLLWLEQLLWPTLAILLYVTFCQVRLEDSRRALGNRRFFAASLTANFILVPALVWVLARLLPDDPAVRLGVFMVLLLPCTDWFVTFTHLGRGDTPLAVAVVPVQLMAQFGFLMVYLWLFLGQEFIQVLAAGPFFQALVGLIAIPFTLAVLTRRAARRWVGVSRWLRVSRQAPAPLLAFTLFLVAASQFRLLGEAAGPLGWAAVVFVLYLVLAAPLARLMSGVFGLATKAGRTLAFNLGTRNSFVVLPLALALPAGWEAAVAVVVLQTVVELLGVLVYLWGVPRYLFPQQQGPARAR
jgi:arsenite transporter